MITGTEYGMLLVIVGVFIAILLILMGALLFKRPKPENSKISSDSSVKTAPKNLEKLTQTSKALEGSQDTQIKRLEDDKDKKDLDEKKVNESNKLKTSTSLINQSLKFTRSAFWDKLSKIFLSSEEENQILEQVEEVLYLSDLGPEVVEHFLSKIKTLDSAQRKDIGFIKGFIQEESARILNQVKASEDLKNLNLHNRPTVFLIVGVNGAGKTTTIGKLAQLACQKGLNVLVAAGDTFRAAAQEQLAVWADRAQVSIFSPEGVKDPGAVAYEAIKKAEREAFDLVLVDTAGRLHTSHNLMEELKKVHKVMQKAMVTAPHEVLLVLDASGGQNAVIQAEQFSKVVPVTGLILTKLDGTAKGGMVLSAVDRVKVPVVWLGVGENAEDLVTFDGDEFAKALVNEI